MYNKTGTAQIGAISKSSTSRERLKSAPYLRLKNSKRTSKCQLFSSTVPAWGKIGKKIRTFLKICFEFFLVYGKSHSAEKCKRGHSGSLWTSIFCKIDKKWRVDPLEIFAKKKSHKAKKICTKKFWSRAGIEPMSFCLADLKKAVTSMPSGSEVVWQWSSVAVVAV